MAGGIFTTRPFEPNAKCVIGGAAAMALYWIKGSNELMLPVIFIVVYVLMAWYDLYYDCSPHMYSGTGVGPSIDAVFKPQRRGAPIAGVPKAGVPELAPDQEREYLKKVYLFHVLVVAPALLYVGVRGGRANKKVFPVVAAMGGAALAYHGARLFYPRETA